jgi:hypothetical protein
MIKLLKYEMFKKQKVSNYMWISFAALQIVLLIIIRLFAWDAGFADMFQDTGKNFHGSKAVSFGLISFAYIVIIIFNILYPLVESSYRFDKDISGKQSPLEIMLPYSAWKKVLSKEIASFLHTIIHIIMSILALLLYAIVVNNFDKNLLFVVFRAVKELLSSPAELTFNFIYFSYVYLSFISLLFLCSTIAKSITHKNKLSSLISIASFIGILFFSAFITFKIDKFPIYRFKIFHLQTSIASLLFDILFFALLFFGVSFLMEKKIEA